MEKWKNKVALVTGASQGLGKCIANTLAKNGMIVVACDIRMDGLEESLKNCKIKPGNAGFIDPVKCDISKVDDILKLFKYIEHKYKTLHACVNNAGGGFLDYFLPIQDKEGNYDGNKEEKEKDRIYKGWKHILEVNILGTLICSKEAINLMAKSGVKNGLIVNVSSILGQRVHLFEMNQNTGYYNHMYIATKHAITAMTQCLRLEVQQHSYANATRIVTIYPGTIKTEIIDNVQDEVKLVSSKIFYEKYSYLTPDDVCDAMLAAFKCNDSVQMDAITIIPVRAPGKLF
ncbi:unnamed protein product [Gordionus sp. m RMFG-2023]|uniref:dehydrogenase/reductase SDR family member 11-like n=1 Tax=Gordionus sp. m RMFG-2023 TaxID=3053472 RepID=UPI0030E153D9